MSEALNVGDELIYKGRRAVVVLRSFYSGEEHCVIKAEEDTWPGWSVLATTCAHVLKNSTRATDTN